MACPIAGRGITEKDGESPYLWYASNFLNGFPVAMNRIRETSKIYSLPPVTVGVDETKTHIGQDEVAATLSATGLWL